MYGKDDRSKDNRKNMKQHNHYHKQQQQQQRRSSGVAGHTSSSSPQTPGVRSIVDVADSSDEPRFARRGWSNSGGGSLAPQKNRSMLDSLPPLDGTDDMTEVDAEGGPIDENARAQLRAGDFKQLSQFPSLGGGHFSFGAEKEWNSIAEGQTQLHTKGASSYFTLNLSLLNCGLQTIPFYKRMDYPTSMFTRQQIIAMNEAAERAEHTYQQRVLCDSNGPGPAAAAAPPKSRVGSAKLAAAPSAGAADDLDELLALTGTQLEQTSLLPPSGETLAAAMPMPMVQPPTPASAATPASKNDVEQWLDSVLDE